MSQKKKVAVVGLGYVGLPTLTAIAQTGLYQAVGFDIDQKKIAQISSGHSLLPINKSPIS